MDENGISRKPDVKRLIADIAMLVGYIVLIAGIGLFLGVSKDVIFSPAAMAVIFSNCLLILPLGYFLFPQKAATGKVATGVSLSLVEPAVGFVVRCLLVSFVV